MGNLVQEMFNSFGTDAEALTRLQQTRKPKQISVLLMKRWTAELGDRLHLCCRQTSEFPDSHRGPGGCWALVPAEYLLTIWNHMAHVGVVLARKREDDAQQSSSECKKPTFLEHLRPWHVIVSEELMAAFKIAFLEAKRPSDNTSICYSAVFYIERL